MEGQILKHICKFCKKGFACGRSLGGHIRSHLPKPGSYELRENPKKTWRVSDHGADVMLSASSPFSSSSSSSSRTELENRKLCKVVHQNQGKRSSLVGNNNSHSCVSEVVEGDEHEEEVAIAMCLIMLSRDVGPWEGFTLAQANNNNNNCKNKRKRGENVQGKRTVFTDVNDENLVSVASGHLQKGIKLKGIDDSGNGFVSIHQNSKRKEKISQVEHSHKVKRYEVSENKSVKIGLKMEEYDVSDTQFLTDDHQNRKDQEFGVLDKSCRIKRSKFECTTCNKVFHSYQALGGHKASHKKLLMDVKDSSPQSKRVDKEVVSMIDSPSHHLDDEQQPQQRNNEDFVTEISIGSSPSKKVVQRHECPVCFRVFTSGQALGGHKRSHMLASNNNEEKGAQNSEQKISHNSKTTNVTERSSSSTETRDMLDLNFPPATVQEGHTTSMTTASSSNSLVQLIKPYWWVENPHKHEALLNLISN